MNLRFGIGEKSRGRVEPFFHPLVIGMEMVWGCFRDVLIPIPFEEISKSVTRSPALQ